MHLSTIHTLNIALLTVSLCACNPPKAGEVGPKRKEAPPCQMKPGAQCANAKLSRRELRYADFRRANFDGADLSKADFSHANLSGASFRRANLAGANLAHANLAHADFSEANLAWVDFTGTLALQTNFSEANVSGLFKDANFTGAIFKDTISPFLPGTQPKTAEDGKTLDLSLVDLPAPGVVCPDGTNRDTAKTCKGHMTP